MSVIQKNCVIVIGGGYAGISLLHKLKKEKDMELILIDKSEKHLLQTHIHKYLSGYYDEEDITFNHKKYCEDNGIEFICDEVINVDYKSNLIHTKNGLDLNYDYVIVATGSISIFPKQIENVTKYTKDIKLLENLDYYRNEFKNLIESKPSNKNIVVVGGGVSGLQIACEYASMIEKKGLDKNNIQVTIVEGMDSILPGMNSFLIKKAQERCEQLGIKVITNLFASKITENKIILSNADEIPYDMLLFVIGAVGNSILNIDENISINQRNQFIVDDYYRIKPTKNAFAIGDIVQANDTKTNTFQAPTAQAARMQAELVAKNILNDINNDSLIKNNISNKGILIDLGGSSCAIGRLFGFNLKGKLAFFFKKLIYSLHSKKFN